ncbi:Zn-dependent peptidase ImmA (M78 family)/transcriptional regulator with XRE-family HTH domain [Bradyrhizobium sp. USDA 4503]
MMLQVERFNRHMMALARESRGITQSELSALMDISQGTVSKIEAGVNEATPAFVEALSRTLQYESAFFFEPGRPYGMPPFHYRKRKKLGKRPLERMIGEMNIRRIHVSILLRSFERKSNLFIPEIDRDEYLSGSRKQFSVEDAARHVRELWMLPDGPIDNVIGLIEERGGVVLPCNFESDLIDAVSQRIDGLPVLFFVNMNAPADRIRLTLCHELGHMILHTSSLLDDEIMEDEADRFAGAFLLPAKEIRPQLQKFDLRQIANLKRHWKVSMAAIAMRADSLKLISPYQKKMFFIQMGQLGYRKAEPHEPPKEYPRAINRMIDYHISVLKYSPEQLAKTLFISVDEFARMYMPRQAPEPGKGRPQLRVIK